MKLGSTICRALERLSMMPRAVVEQRDQMGFVGLGREIASDDPASASAGPSSLNDLVIVSMAGDGKITGQLAMTGSRTNDRRGIDGVPTPSTMPR